MRLVKPLLRQISVSLDPYQILAVPRSASTSEIKEAYLRLVKKHHPDRPTSSKPQRCEFTDIVAAFELLRNPRQRDAYLKYGMGWSPAGSAGLSQTPAAGFDYHNMHHNPWGNPKSRPYKHAYQRGRYPSQSYDFGHSDTTDFFSHSSNATHRKGVYTSNVSFISTLAGLSLLLYSVQFWRLAPQLPLSADSIGFDSLTTGDPRDAPIYNSSIVKSRDKHHDEASSALAAAREGAQRWGARRRDDIRKRVRGSTLEAVESGKVRTGHDIASFEALEMISRADDSVHKREKPLQQYPTFILSAKSSPRKAAGDNDGNIKLVHREGPDRVT